jgi:micrococcal nuclease
VAKAALLLLATVLVEVLDFVPNPSAPPPVVASNNFRICGWLNRVDCVIDGDTIYHNRGKIRLSDIDTPEISKPK